MEGLDLFFKNLAVSPFQNPNQIFFIITTFDILLFLALFERENLRQSQIHSQKWLLELFNGLRNFK